MSERDSGRSDVFFWKTDPSKIAKSDAFGHGNRVTLPMAAPEAPKMTDTPDEVIEVMARAIVDFGATDWDGSASSEDVAQAALQALKDAGYTVRRRDQ